MADAVEEAPAAIAAAPTAPAQQQLPPRGPAARAQRPLRAPRRGTEEARALLQTYLRTLSRDGNHDDMVHVMCNEGANGDFFPQRTWLNINFGDASPRQVAHVRALVEIVSRLAHSTDFRWREFYHAFWQRALMDPLACSACRQTFDRNPDPTEYDDFERLMQSTAPRFVLDFSKTGEPDDEVDDEDEEEDEEGDEEEAVDGDERGEEGEERADREQPHVVCTCGRHHDDDDDDDQEVLFDFGNLDDDEDGPTAAAAAAADNDATSTTSTSDSALPPAPREPKDKLELLRAFLFMDPESALSDRHLEVLTRLSAPPAASASCVSSTNPPLPPRIELGLVLSAHSVSTAEYKALAALLDEFEASQRIQTNATTTHFYITTLWVLPDKPLSVVDIDVLTTLVTREASTIEHFMFGYAAVTLTAASDRVRAFQQFVQATLTASPSHLATLQLHDAPLEHQHIASICSALRYPNALRELTLEYEDELSSSTSETVMPEVLWAWLAFGIWHPDAAARLDLLDVSGLPLNRDDLVAFDQVLRSPHPARQLWLLEHGDVPRGGHGLKEMPLPVNERVFVHVRTHAKVRAFPNVRAAVVSTLTSTSLEFEVAIALTQWICVVVPGVGLGWIGLASIVGKRHVASKCVEAIAATPARVDDDPTSWAVAAPHVKTFARHMLDDDDLPDDERNEDEEPRTSVIDDVADLLLLLQMIGRDLDGFAYPLHDVDVSEDDLRTLLVACPNLKHLNLKGNALVSIAPLLERFEAPNCRLRCVNVDSVTDQTHILEQLTTLVASRTSAPLRYVEVNGLVDTPAQLEALATALETNDSIEMLSVYLEYPEHERAEVLSSIQAAVEGVVLGSRLDARTKLAFLSVVHFYAHAPVPSASDIASSPRTGVARLGGSSSLGHLDASVVSEIFAFAAIPIPRSMIW